MILHWPENERIIVAYSGGKDSIVLSDLAMKHVKNVKLFFMYFIAGLDYTEHWCSFAEKRWGVEVHRMMSWTTTQLLHAGSFCNAYPVRCLSMIDTERNVAARQRLRLAGWQCRDGDAAQRFAGTPGDAQLMGLGVSPTEEQTMCAHCRME